METMQKKFSGTSGNIDSFPFVTIGTVVDTNDPQQMGRVRVVCPILGDSLESDMNDIPWAIYISPFGGQVGVGTRGCSLDESQGGVTYGLWAIPKVGAMVTTICIDGDQQHRAYFGCIYDQFTPHTMPHGRWAFDDHPELPESQLSPVGPMTTREKFIEPTRSNAVEAFGGDVEMNYEWKTRVADYQVAAIDVAHINRVYSKVPDDKNIEKDKWTSTQGYQLSRVNPNLAAEFTDVNLDSLTVSLTSPGFHSIAMDDRQENCRIRIRTTGGNQIILDDTNERIYISTTKGENWIEMDQNGNIDMYSSSRISVRAKDDINFTSDKTIRLHATDSINLYTKDIHFHATHDINSLAEHNISDTALNDIESSAGVDFRQNTVNNMHIDAGNLYSQSARVSAFEGRETMVLTTETMQFESKTDINLISNVIKLQSSGKTHIKAGGNINFTSGDAINSEAANYIGSSAPTGGDSIDSAITATSGDGTLNTISPTYFKCDDAKTIRAKWTNKVPEHEPYARVMTKDDFTHEPEIPYDDENVGRKERKQTISRGTYWRR